MLSQISRCYDYCRRYGRVLVVDTENSTVFASPFDSYFSFECSMIRIVTDPRDIIRSAIDDGLTVHPSHASLKPAADRRPRYEAGSNFCVDGLLLTFDFDREHEAQVLIHQQCGRAPFDLEFLSCLRMSARLRRLVERRWAGLPKPYIGIHVRNTDRKSDPGVVMRLLRRYPGGVFLATDSAEAQRSMRRLAGRRVFTSKIPDFRGAALHTRCVSHQVKERINTMAIVDLVLLALSKRVYLSAENSGYSRLARVLNRNRRVVAAWLGRDLTSGVFPWWRESSLALGKMGGWLPRYAAWLSAPKVR